MSGAPFYEGPPVPGSREGHVRLLGLTLAHNGESLPALCALLDRLEREEGGAARVIEVGTLFGGLAALLGVYARGGAAGLEVVTFDREDHVRHHDLLRRLDVDARRADLSTPAGVEAVAAEVRREGLTVVLCDGAHKAAAFDALSRALKPGDLILAHDYAYDDATFAREVHGRLWSWHEVRERDLAAACEREGLEPYMEAELRRAAWACRRKRAAPRPAPPAASPPAEPPPRALPAPPGAAPPRVALYVLTYEAPRQLQAWLERAREVDPAWLEATTPHVLDNSQDPAARAAVDALCERHGLRVLRAGENLGATGGRVRCARHFAGSDADVMAYFEDDLLLAGRPGRCRNGLATHVPDLLRTSLRVLARERLDYLKLSFTEHWGDHHRNWAWFHLGPRERVAHFPRGAATRVEHTGAVDGCGYLVGDVFYSNWPMVLTRSGSARLFEGITEEAADERLLMGHAQRLLHTGHLRAGVLLASPICHERTQGPAGERREGRRQESGTRP